MKTAESPFGFVAASYLTRINNQQASSLNELRAGLDHASDASIFYHTFQSLGRHHFLVESFSNDFAQWVMAALNRPVLAEWLGGLDIRDYVSLADLRGDLRRLTTEYCDAHSAEAGVTAFEPFYFCESVVHLSHSAFYYHFIASRLRLQLRTNDFSQWLSGSLEADDLARRVNRIDIYTNTLDSAREEMVSLIDREVQRQ